MASSQNILMRLRQSRLAKDSFWAVFGNGLGYGLLLVAGIVIARFLGKDVYGEYSLVKMTMLYIAGFSTFGLGTTSTKYIADALQRTPSRVQSIASDALRITLAFSAMLALLLVALATPLSRFLGQPELTGAFRALGAIIICKALNTTQNGILAGFGDFKAIARNNVAAGALMLAACVPLTYFFGFTGALGSLLASQAANTLLNIFSLRTRYRSLPQQKPEPMKRELMMFSLPIALQELNFTVCSWGGIALLTKLSSVGQVGIYTASAQWISVITFIPGLLNNVILSHLSGTLADRASHKRTLKTTLAMNFISTLIPFIAIFLLAGWITGFYGPSFAEMADVLRVMTFATIFSACSNVYYSELIASGHNWLTFMCRLLQEGSLFLLGWLFLANHTFAYGALDFGFAYLSSAIISFLAPFTVYLTLKASAHEK